MKNKIYRYIIVILFTCYINAGDNYSFNLDKMQYIDSVAYRLMDERIYPGLAVSVGSLDSIIYHKNFGLSNVEAMHKINDKTVYRIYSMTKPITSVAILKLVEKGLIDLDDPIKKYLPEFENMKRVCVIDLPYLKHLFHFKKKVKNDITIFHLLTHTSGLYYDFTSRYGSVYKSYQKNNLYKTKSLKNAVKEIAKLPLLFEPGTEWTYGHSTDVLGRIIEVVTRKKFEKFLEDELFLPLEMFDTGFKINKDIDELSYVYKHSIDRDKKLNMIDYIQYPMGGAGLYSTMSDYYKFCLMLLNDGVYKNKRILSVQSLKLMKTNHLSSLDDQNSRQISKRMPIDLVEDYYDFTFPMDGFGLGLFINESLSNQKSIANTNKYGWWGIANTFFFIDDEHQFFVIIMGQSASLDPGSIVRRFENVIYQSIEPNE